MYAFGSVSQPLHLRIQPGCPPPESLPARGTGVAEGHALSELAVFLERPVRQALLVAQLHPAQVEHAILHGRGHPLAPAGLRALEQRRDDAKREMQPGPGIADLGTGHKRRPIAEAGGRGRSAGALGDVLVDLAIFVWARPEALDRSEDDLRVELLDPRPGEPHAVERTGSEILDHHVTGLHQPLENLLAVGVLGIDRDGALVVVQHREIEAVHAGDVTQLPAGDVSLARTLDLDHVRAEPRQKLRAGRPRLDVGEVQDLDAFESFHCILSLLKGIATVTPASSWKARSAG